MTSKWLAPARREKGRFFAPVSTEVGGLPMMWKALQERMRSRAETVPRAALPQFRTDSATYATPSRTGLRVTWFGHSSVLLELDGVRLLLDPVWDERASFVPWAGPRRFFPPTLPLAELPALDAVLLSHDHYDHLGEGTVRALAKLHPALRWIAPLRVGRILRRFGVAAVRITELDWTQSTLVRAPDGAGEGVTVTSVPARHFSGRALWNRNGTLWCAYALRGPRHRVYCGADTGLWPGFAEIASSLGPFDLTLLEVGAFNELWRAIHLGPAGALQAFEELNPGPARGVLMPIHWGLFNLALHGWREPIEQTLHMAAARGVPVFSPAPGEPADVTGEPLVSHWWQPARP